MNTARTLNFAPMGIHIGQEVKRVFDASGLTKTAFASMIGRERTNVYAIFEGVGVDSELLVRISKALHFNFFRAYNELVERELHSSSMVNEPNEEYQAKKPAGTLRVVIEMADDDEARKRAAEMVRGLGGSQNISTSETK